MFSIYECSILTGLLSFMVCCSFLILQLNFMFLLFPVAALRSEDISLFLLLILWVFFVDGGLVGGARVKPLTFNIAMDLFHH